MNFIIFDDDQRFSVTKTMMSGQKFVILTFLVDFGNHGNTNYSLHRLSLTEGICTIPGGCSLRKAAKPLLSPPLGILDVSIYMDITQ